MKNLHNRLSVYAVFCRYCLFAACIFLWSPLVFAAEAVPDAAGSDSASGLLLGLAVMAGAALGVGTSWLYRRRNTGGVSSQPPASQAAAPADLNAANSLTTGFIHEFNNTLCTIQGFTDLAILRSSGQGPERQGLEQIRIGTQRSTKLLEQLERFHMEAHTAQPVPLGLLLKGYGRWLQGLQEGPVGDGRPGQKAMPARLVVQVQDTISLVLAQPVQVQRLLALLHQAVMTGAGSGEEKQVQLVLRQAVIDRVGDHPSRLELTLQGMAALPAASTGELEQLASDLGGSLTLMEANGAKVYSLALPGLPASVSQA